MEWLVILAMVLALPVGLILALLILVWYMDAGGIYSASKELKDRRITGAKLTRKM